MSEGDGPETTATDGADTRTVPSPPPSRRPSRGSRGARGALLVVLCALGSFLAGAGWALSSPVGSSPDDDYHMVSIWCAASDDSPECTRVGETADGKPIVRVPALLTAAACYAGNSAVSGECQQKIVRMGDIDTDRVNTTDYPGGFYRVMSLMAGSDIPTSVVVMRLVNVLLAVALFTALALSGTRATRRIQLYTLTAVLVPVGWFLIASVNPSGWAVTGVSAFGFGLHSAFTVRGRRRVAVNGALAAIGAAMAMSARGDAAIFVAVVALAVCLLHWRSLLRRPLLLLMPAAATVASAVVALTSGQVAGAASPEPETTRSGAEVLVGYVFSFPTLISGFFGYGWGLGWIDTYMPALTVCLVMTVVGFLGLRGVARLNAGKVLALLVLGGVMVIIPFLTLYRARLVVGEAVQPRYILPLAPVLLLVLLTGRRAERAIRMTGSQAVTVWVLLSLANAAALYTNTWRYVTGTDDATLAADVEWWWWTGGPGPVTTWILASVAFSCFAAAVVAVSGPTPLTRRATNRTATSSKGTP